jgi:arylsulfatase A-like enzyme
MSVRAFSLIVMLAFSASMAYSSLHAAENERRPNFVFILADDLGPGDLSCCGGTSAKTPVLDQLAAEGIRFTQFTVASPICSPSRVAFTTGMYPSRWRISSYLNTRKGNREAEQADYLDPRAPSLARLLKSHGYATGHFGKWHMGGGRDVDDAPKISVYGFDAWHGTWESPDAGEDPRNLKGDQAVPHHLRTPFFLAKAADFIKAHRSGPFYVQIWLNQVHDAHIPSPEKLKTLGPKPTKQQKAAADVEEMDAHLKPFLP